MQIGHNRYPNLARDISMEILKQQYQSSELYANKHLSKSILMISGITEGQTDLLSQRMYPCSGPSDIKLVLYYK